MAAFTGNELKTMQQRPSERKVNVTITKLLELCLKTNWKVAVSFSGGKDSTVLLDITSMFWANNRELHQNSKLVVVFANTSNEFIGIEKFVKEYCAHMEIKHNIQIDLHIVRSQKKNYYNVIKEEGYPVGSKRISRQIRDIRKWIDKEQIDWTLIKDKLDMGIESANMLRNLNASHTVVLYLTGVKQDDTFSKHYKLSKKWRPLVIAPFEISEKCCEILKKAPMKEIEKKLKLSPIIGEMADDSGTRRAAYLQTGCNSFKKGKARSKPMGFWLEQDVLWYIDTYSLPYFKVYGDLVNENGIRYFTGEQRTGCKLCLFGVQMGCGNLRIERLRELEPNTVSFALKPISEKGLGYKEVIDYLNANCKCKIKY